MWTKEHKLEYQRKWRKDNPEKSRSYWRKWSENNKDKIKDYQDKNREHHKELCRRRNREVRGGDSKIVTSREKYPDWYPTSVRKSKIDELKGNVCSICGDTLPSCCLDFHHRNPSEKEYPIPQLRMAPPEKILAEIAKCDVVCANCHRKIHHLTEED